MAKYPLEVALGENGSGYLDPLIPDLYLSNNRNIVKRVPEGAPLDNIVKAVHNRVLRVVSGSIDEELKAFRGETVEEQSEEVAQEEVVETTEVVEVEPVVEETLEVSEATEEEDFDDEEATEEYNFNQCIEITTRGTRCKNDALEGEQYCGTHIKKYR